MIRQVIITEDEDGLVITVGREKTPLLDHKPHALQLVTTALFALCNLPPSDEDVTTGRLAYYRKISKSPIKKVKDGPKHI